MYSRHFSGRNDLAEENCNLLGYVLKHCIFRVPIVKQDVFDKINFLLMLVFYTYHTGKCPVYQHGD